MLFVATQLSVMSGQPGGLFSGKRELLMGKWNHHRRPFLRLILSASRRSSVKRASRVHGKYFGIPNGLEGRRVDTTGRHDGFVRMVRAYDTPTGRRNKILLKLIRALGHVCKGSRRRRRRLSLAEDDATRRRKWTVWARYFNEFWYFDTFPTSCYALRRFVPSFPLYLLCRLLLFLH